MPFRKSYRTSASLKSQWLCYVFLLVDQRNPRSGQNDRTANERTQAAQPTRVRQHHYSG